MKLHDLKKKTDIELRALMTDVIKELQSLRFSASMATLKAVRNIRKQRKLRARIHTLLRERQQIQ